MDSINQGDIKGEVKSQDHQDGFDYPSSRSAWTAVAVLSLTYMFSLMDRQILFLLIEPIKQDLNITDTQVGLLTGVAFAVVYTVMGIPFGRLADLWVRKYVIIMGVSIWSVLTIVSGFSKTFTHLFFARMGVGLGEAGLTAPAYATIADLFPPKKLAFAMSIFVLGGSIGSALSMLLGGMAIGFVESLGSVSLPWLGELQPWRLVLIIVGLASLLVVIPLALMVEPKRHGKVARKETDREGGALSEDQPLSLVEVLLYLYRKRNFYGFFILAVVLNAVIAYGAAVWMPSYFIRLHDWDPASIGISLGLVTLFPVVLGGLAAGKMIDYFYQQGHKDAAIRLMLLVGPLLLLSLSMFVYIPLVSLKFVAVAVYYFFSSMYAAVFPTVIQIATPMPIRAQTSAMILFIVNLIGMGLGPASIAFVTDYIFHDELAVGRSIFYVGLVSFSLSILAFWRVIKPFNRQLANVVEDG